MADNNAPYRVLPDLVQGSQEWLDVRKQHITGTEVAHLWAGKISFKELKEQKLGLRPVPDLSKVPAVQEGKLFEPMIRGYLETACRSLLCPNTGKLPTPCLESTSEPFFMVSLDGLTEAGQPVEIKNSYSRSKSDFDDVLIHGPDSAVGKAYGYVAQVQWEIYLTGAQGACFVCHKSDDGKTLSEDHLNMRFIKRDEAIIRELVAIATAFKEYFLNGVEPHDLAFNGRIIGGTVANPAFEKLLSSYRAIDAMYEEKKALLDKIKEERSALANQLCEGFIPDGATKFSGDGFTLLKTVRKGSLDGAKLAADLLKQKICDEAFIEQHRRSETVSCSVKLEAAASEDSKS